MLIYHFSIECNHIISSGYLAARMQLGGCYHCHHCYHAGLCRRCSSWYGRHTGRTSGWEMCALDKKRHHCCLAFETFGNIAVTFLNVAVHQKMSCSIIFIHVPSFSIVFHHFWGFISNLTYFGMRTHGTRVLSDGYSLRFQSRCLVVNQCFLVQYLHLLICGFYW